MSLLDKLREVLGVTDRPEVDRVLDERDAELESLKHRMGECEDDEARFLGALGIGSQGQRRSRGQGQGDERG